MHARLAVLSLLAAFTACGSSERPRLIRLQGAGASFPAPLYGRWFKVFNAAHPNVQIDYQSVGSGSGVKSVIDGTIDFAASDAAMTAEEIERVPRGIQLLPMTAGSIVLSYNLPHVEELKLSREAYTGIFLGKIKSWDDAAIASANPGVQLPKLPINLVVRADSSGTSFVISQHLSAVSEEFAKNPGTNKMPNWPAGTRAKGNEGIASNLKSTPGSIGYLEYGYAETQHMPMASLQNKSGAFVRASTESGQSALKNAKLSADLVGWNPDPAEPASYPIATYTWLCVYRHYDDAQELEALRDFVHYGASEGQQFAESLGYIPLPDDVRKQVIEAVDKLAPGKTVASSQ
ncbi:MAG TPA: phosphate ABC transporter substrate-binding protein PstS [Polyangiales bacterium]|nr:phosphate ABC transporter substrate-binding protein PstS [Polyangiales bacterium]